MNIKTTIDMKLITALNEPVHNLHHSLYPEIFKPFNTEKMHEYFANAVRFEGQHFMICEDGESAIGYVWFQEVFRLESAFRYLDHHVYINQISVNEDHRGKGAGKLLFDAVLKFAEDNDIKRIGLDYWAKNESAKEIYEKLGFSVEKEVAYLNL